MKYGKKPKEADEEEAPPEFETPWDTFVHTACNARVQGPTTVITER